MFCIKCGTQIGEVNFCPTCGAAKAGLTDASVAASGAKPAVTISLVEKWKAWSLYVKFLISAGVIGVLLIAMGFIGVFENGDIAECKRLVKESLKSPSTAHFLESSVTYDKSGDTGEKSISVKGTVEAQNGFGALITGEYWCTNYNTDELELEFLSSK